LTARTAVESGVGGKGATIVLIVVWLIFSGPGGYSVDGLIAWRVGFFGVER
jgi:hypothetical protein